MWESKDLSTNDGFIDNLNIQSGLKKEDKVHPYILQKKIKIHPCSREKDKTDLIQKVKNCPKINFLLMNASGWSSSLKYSYSFCKDKVYPKIKKKDKMYPSKVKKIKLIEGKNSRKARQVSSSCVIQIFKVVLQSKVYLKI